jgi:hypothetical protein
VTDKDLARGRGGTAIAKIGRQGLGNLGQQRERQWSAGLRLPNRDESASPLHIVEAELPDVRGAHSVADREQEHGVVPPANRTRSIN